MKYPFRIYYLFSLVFIACLMQSIIYAQINFDDHVQDFVLETKKITIPGYHNAFNPGIIRWKNAYYLSFRHIPDPSQSYNSFIGIIKLDDDFNPVGVPQLLNTADPNSNVTPRAEDARFIVAGDILWLIYSDNRDFYLSKGGFRVHIAQVDVSEERFTLSTIECLSNYEGESNSVREKNWVPFVYQDELFLAYSLQPHLIFKPCIGTGTCETVCSSHCSTPWKWGELRGGTPAEIDDGRYIAFFHSGLDMLSAHSNGRSIAHYFMGAYTFSAHPPFEITHISPEPIFGKGFYGKPYHQWYWKSVRVVFPGGILIEKDYIWVSYGRQDHEMWLLKLDKKALLETLIPVSYQN